MVRAALLGYRIVNPYTGEPWRDARGRVRLWETCSAAEAARRRGQRAWRAEFGTELGDDECEVRPVTSAGELR